MAGGCGGRVRRKNVGIGLPLVGIALPRGRKVILGRERPQEEGKCAESHHRQGKEAQIRGRE